MSSQLEAGHLVLIVCIGALVAVGGAFFDKDALVAVGATTIGGALGIAQMAHQVRSPHARTRATDRPRTRPDGVPVVEITPEPTMPGLPVPVRRATEKGEKP